MLFFIPLCDVYAPVMLPCFGSNMLILGACTHIYMLVFCFYAPKVASTMLFFSLFSPLLIA